MDTTTLLKRGFAVWWRYKVLWGLGALLALFGRGYGVTINLGVVQPEEVPADLVPALLSLIPEELTPETVVGSLVTVTLILFGLWIVLLLVGNLVEAAAIVQTDLLDRRGQFDVSGSFAIGTQRMIPLFLLDIVLSIPALVIGLLIIIAVGVLLMNLTMMASDAPGVEMLAGAVVVMLGVVLCLSIPLLIWGFVLSLWRPLAVRVCVLEQQGPVASIKRGWAILRRNLGQVVIVWLVLLGIGVIYSLPVGAIAGVLWAVTAANPLTNFGLWVAITILFNLIFAVIFGGILASLNVALWNVGYWQWTGAAPAMEQVYAPVQIR
ncbi:MAG: hypothetical protein KatS3mg055_0047 [Chloroflexus sp.]|uniref:hypothetical protein n=1 Tax=Chloroflexus sp. TaxID=1904827 RepID=UPI0021DCA599|nr:hypothetical protein [Chloroflexus sp.]GIV87529.1 MAG: hypothetical protein KatS3mg055_0047 [Chloroflexus sp.]